MEALACCVGVGVTTQTGLLWLIRNGVQSQGITLAGHGIVAVSWAANRRTVGATIAVGGFLVVTSWSRRAEQEQD